MLFLIKYFKKLIYFFSNEKHKSNFSELDEKIGACLVGSLMSFFQAIFCYIIGLRIDSIIALLLLLASFTFLMCLKHKIISNIAFSRLQAFVFALAIWSINLDAGMQVNPSMMWIPVASVILIILLGIREGFIWNIFFLLILYFSMLLAKYYNYTFNEFNPHQWFIIGSSNILATSFTLIGMFSYFYYKKNSTITSNQPLVELAQTTSFLMHEISKPINRIKNTNDYHNEDVKSIIELYTLASALSKNTNNYDNQLINLEKLMNKVISKYQSYIDQFNIEINLSNLNHSFELPEKNFEIVIDNIIRNAIENYSSNSKYFINIKLDDQKIIFENPSIFKIFDNYDLTPGISSKPGHMGMGLYIIKRLLNAMNYQFEIFYDKNSKTVKNVINLSI